MMHTKILGCAYKKRASITSVEGWHWCGLTFELVAGDVEAGEAGEAGQPIGQATHQALVAHIQRAEMTHTMSQESVQQSDQRQDIVIVITGEVAESGA
jgi:hypothetical protein